MKNKKAYTIYEYNQFTNDFEYIKELYNIKDVQQEYKGVISSKSIYHYITDSIDNIKHLLNDKYIIIKEDIPII